MKRKQLWKTGLYVLLASAMMIASVPVTSQAAEVEPQAASTPILDSAIKTYDFNEWSVVAGDEGKLTDGSNQNIILEAVSGGRKPVLKGHTSRGKVLAFTQQDYGNRGDALLPENPFAGKSVEQGFTLNFWTKTTGKAEGNRCLVDFEVAPATKGRAGTIAINQQMVYWNTTDQNTYFTDYNVGGLNLEQSAWKMVTMTITKTELAFYADGQKINHSLVASKTKNGEMKEDLEQMMNELAGTGKIAQPEETKVRLGASLATYWQCAGAWLDDVSFFDRALSAEDVQALYDETHVVAEPVKSIVIKGSHTVNEKNPIQLTVQLIPEDASDIDGKTITWKAADENILTVDTDGRIMPKTPGSTTVTAAVTGTEITSEPFVIEVVGAQESLESGKYYLTAYSTTKDFYVGRGGAEAETRSVYLAVSKDGQSFEALNSGGGVAFANSGSRKITAPKIMRQDGKFVIVAEDDEAGNGVHVFNSEDGVHYYNQEWVDSYDGEMPRILKKDNFKLMLDGKDILASDSSITLGNALELTEQEYKYIVDKLGKVVNTGLEEMESLVVGEGEDVVKALQQQRPSVNATYNDGSVQQFNIDWSEALKGKDLSKPGTYELSGKVMQKKYLNNLKALNGSKLEEDDPENVNGNFPDNYDPQNKKVYYDKTKFIEGMADPMIYWDEKTGYYYMTSTYFPEEGDAMEGESKPEMCDRVVLRRGRTIEELQKRKGNQIVIWKVGNQGYEDNGNQVDRGYRFIWAPEIHRVGSNWVIYFTESQDPNSGFGIYCHALVLDGEKDPYETALKNPAAASQWADHKMRVDGNFADPFGTSFCLDMTYFKDAVNGQSYVVWPGKPSIGNTDIHIAKVSEEEPWKITSAATHLTQPDYGWERIHAWVNEGPTVLQKNGKIFLCYSAAGTGSEYAVGMLTADQGADLLDINNWIKSPYPVLTSRDVNGEEGPGHNSFTVDQDGNTIFVYHARPTSHNYERCGWDGNKSTYTLDPLYDSCRHARLKRVHWAADGTPILKMTYEEELKEENKTVFVKVTVAPSHAIVDNNTCDIKLNHDTLGIEAGKSVTLETTVVPVNAKVEWNSVNPSIASVQDGRVTAKKPGTTTITAISNGKKATCKITVVSLSRTKAALGVKESCILKVSGAQKKVNWKSSNAKTSVKNGKVTAKKPGKAIITAEAEGVTLKCSVTIKAAPKKLVLKSKSRVVLRRGKTCKIKVSLPKNTAGTLKYKSSKKSVATVDAKGKVKAKKKGNAKITVYAANNSKKARKVISVTVK